MGRVTRLVGGQRRYRRHQRAPEGTPQSPPGPTTASPAAPAAGSLGTTTTSGTPCSSYRCPPDAGALTIRSLVHSRLRDADLAERVARPTAHGRPLTPGWPC